MPYAEFGEISYTCKYCSVLIERGDFTYQNILRDIAKVVSAGESVTYKRSRLKHFITANSCLVCFALDLGNLTMCVPCILKHRGIKNIKTLVNNNSYTHNQYHHADGGDYVTTYFRSYGTGYYRININQGLPQISCRLCPRSEKCITFSQSAKNRKNKFYDRCAICKETGYCIFYDLKCHGTVKKTGERCDKNYIVACCLECDYKNIKNKKMTLSASRQVFFCRDHRKKCDSCGKSENPQYLISTHRYKKPTINVCYYCSLIIDLYPSIAENIMSFI